MSTGHRISEVARRSGFSPATLRYYEEIGLLPAPVRTEAGYRRYDDAALARLAFIARVKHLGCTLDEITALAQAWEGGRCAPLQDRLRETVRAKIDTARARIVELATLVADLQRTAAALDGHRPEGPCDDDCGCTRVPAGATAGDGPAAPGLVCTLSPQAVPARLEAWQALLGFVVGRSAFPGGERLEFGAGVPIDDLARLAAAEQQCCASLSFAITIDERGVGLDVHAPDDALPILQSLFGAPAL